MQSMSSIPDSFGRNPPASTNVVGVVIPTLARDLLLLEKAIRSATEQICVGMIVLVTNSSNFDKLLPFSSLDRVRIIQDDQPGFTNAMNLGVEVLHQMGFPYFCGIGDDDVLAPGFLDSILEKMQRKNADVGLGHCFYVNTKNEIIFKNRSPIFLTRVLHLIPNVIPAPGALIKTETWKKVNGFDPAYTYVADFDFWLKIKKRGKFVKSNIPMSYFRWHDKSLTAGNRAASRKEALQAQLHHTPNHQKVLFYTFTRVSYFFADKLMKHSMKSSYKEIHMG